MKAMMQLNEAVNGGIDFMKTNDQTIKTFIKSIKFEEPPQSNLVIKKGVIKRDTGTFGSFKDSTAILTRDK